MAELPRIAVTGVSGRMGQMLVELVTSTDRATLSGATERPDHEWIGRDLGECLPGSSAGITVQEDPIKAMKNSDAIIDFTTPAASVANAAHAADLGLVLVIGTTGFTDQDLSEISESARHTTIVRAGNMSMGVNLLVQITKKVAAALDEDFDVEVVEAHHRYKVDAPSGTALMLGDAAAEGRGTSLANVSDRGRDGQTGPRRRGNIGFSAIRGGNVVGEHDVIFAGNGERVILRHVATDRAIYAQGALKAALWGLRQPNGEFNMVDVLGL